MVSPFTAMDAVFEDQAVGVHGEDRSARDAVDRQSWIFSFCALREGGFRSSAPTVQGYSVKVQLQ